MQLESFPCFLENAIFFTHKLFLYNSNQTKNLFIALLHYSQQKINKIITVTAMQMYNANVPRQACQDKK